MLDVERLTHLPRSGRMVPEAGYKDAIREVSVQEYRIIYRIKNEHTVQSSPHCMALVI